MNDLVALEQYSQTEQYVVAASELSKIVTPLKSRCWEACLQHHPDIVFAQYINDGVRRGFWI